MASTDERWPAKPFDARLVGASCNTADPLGIYCLGLCYTMMLKEYEAQDALQSPSAVGARVRPISFGSVML